MFNKTKTQFEIGDTVSLKKDLTTQLKVEKVWIVVKSFGQTEMVALSNDIVVTSDEINYYSYPINKLANENVELNKKIINLQLEIDSTKKELSEIKDKVIKKDISGLYYIWGTMLNSTYGLPETPKVKTLEERIEELESKLVKKTKTTKIVKNTKKSKK